jgi:hypothetical protein
MARGGYQKPSNPAPVSGPGALSRRTDGGGAGQPQQRLANAAYGEQKAFGEIQAGAEMAQSERAPMPQVTPLSAPTERPDEPVTAGAPMGPGPGPEAMGMSMGIKGQSSMDAKELAKYMPSLERTAKAPGAPASFVRFVRYLRTQQNA